MSAIFATLGGFTPMIDSLRDRYGPVTAIVFGTVWRYCQMKDRVCKASLEEIARASGFSKMTVVRHLKTLVSGGYLKDLTPNLRDKPHIYADTGKARITASINAEDDGVTESYTGVSESDSGSNRKLPQESHKVTLGVTESQLSKTLLRDSLRDKDDDVVVEGSENFSNFSDFEEPETKPEPPPPSSPQSPKSSPEEQAFLENIIEMFSEKFSNQQQIKSVLNLRAQYGEGKALEMLTWYADKGNSLSDAIPRAKGAAPTWGKKLPERPASRSDGRPKKQNDLYDLIQKEKQKLAQEAANGRQTSRA